MLSERIDYLLTALIANTITSDELSEFLAGLDDPEIEERYGVYLYQYFEKLLAGDAVES